MDVEVRNLLVRVPAVVGEDTEAALVQAMLSRDGAHGAEKCGNLDVARLGGEIGEADISTLRNHQDVRRRLRPGVVEGQHVLVLIDILARDLAAEDAGKDVVPVVFHDQISRYALLTPALFSSIPEVPSRRASSANTSSGFNPIADQRTRR